MIILWLVPLSSLGQGVLSLPDMNILYRGYENILQIGSADYKKPVVLSGTNVSLMLSDTSTNTYVARVNGSGKEATIYVLSKNLRDTLTSYKYRIRNLPPPELFLGSTEAGAIIDTLESTIYSRYGENVFGPTTFNFQVLCYELIIEGEETNYKGPGGTLSIEAMNAINIARSKPRKEEFLHITIQVKVKGPDGITRLKSGTFQIK